MGKQLMVVDPSVVRNVTWSGPNHWWYFAPSNRPNAVFPEMRSLISSPLSLTASAVAELIEQISIITEIVKTRIDFSRSKCAFAWMRVHSIWNNLIAVAYLGVITKTMLMVCAAWIWLGHRQQGQRVLLQVGVFVVHLACRFQQMFQPRHG